MPRNSGGTYTQPGGTAAVTASPISSSAYNTLISDLGQETTNSLDRLGRAPMEAPLPMGGFRVTGGAAAVAGTDLPTLAQVQALLVPAVVTVTTTALLTTAQFGALVEITGASTVVTSLPTAAGNGGYGYDIWNNSAVVQTLTAVGGVIYGPGASGTASMTVQPGAVVSMRSDGTNYIVKSNTAPQAAVILTTATTIQSGQVGSILEMTGGTLFVTTLPAPSLCSGEAFAFWNAGTVSQTLSTPSGVFSGFGAGGAATFSVVAGASGLLYSDGTNWVLLAFTAPPVVHVGTRQTVTSGPVDTNGNSTTLLPATSGSLSITTTNVSASVPLVATGAQGVGANGNIDYVSAFTSNVTWSGLTGSTTNYLYINAQTGALGFTTLQPIYQFGGTPSIVNGQFTFNVGQMIGYLGNGSVAAATPLVFVGEAVTGASTITSAIAYAYNGMYDSGYTAALPAGGTGPVTKASNLGVAEASAMVIVKCTTTDQGYAVGDTLVTMGGAGQAGIVSPMPIFHSRLTVGFVAGNNTVWETFVKSTGVRTQLTLADWSYKIVAKRMW